MLGGHGHLQPVSSAVMTCQEVAVQYGVCHSAVSHWAAANGVAYTGEGRRKTYNWTEEDCLRFAERKRPGWEKGKPRK